MIYKLNFNSHFTMPESMEYWNIGILEYLKNGIMKILQANIIPSFHYSIIPMLLFLLTTITLGQENNSGILLEKNILPADSGFNCYVSYRIPYKRFFFTKEENKFTTRFSFSFEAIDSASGRIVREISNNSFSVSSYDETKYDDKYFQGIVKLHLLYGTYRIIPIFTNENSENPVRLHDITFSLKFNTEEQVFQPVLMASEKIHCNSDSAFVLANYEGNVPFSSTLYNLVIPVKDNSADKLSVEIINNDSLVLKSDIRQSFLGNIELLKCGNNLVCESGSGFKTKNFVLNGFNKKLSEGSLVIKIFNGTDSVKYGKQVVWFDKPFSLTNFGFAAKLIRYISDDPEIKSIGRNETEESRKIFDDFWEKMDPTPESSFNELIEEFYSRADYAFKEFSLINGKNGAETDRGKVYIQFGKPDNIQRLYSPDNTREIWYYKVPARKFIFTDKSGLGNFILENKAL